MVKLKKYAHTHYSQYSNILRFIYIKSILKYLVHTLLHSNNDVSPENSNFTNLSKFVLGKKSVTSAINLANGCNRTGLKFAHPKMVIRVYHYISARIMYEVLDKAGKVSVKI